MSKVKTNKVSNKNTYESPIPFPVRHSFDELAVMDDESLSELGRSLNDSVHRAGSHGLNSTPWEVELCYVQRESQVRSARREAHQRYVASARGVE